LVPEKEQDNHIKRPKNQVQTTVQQHEQEIVDRIFYGIAFPLMQVTQNDLQANNDDIDWRGEHDDKLFPKRFNHFANI
jgi:hypothetical protein